MAKINKDLEIIKRKYGEKMSHLCRELFPTLLETEGLLSDLILSKFNEDKSLYDVIMDNNKQADFKNYIYSFIDVKKNNKVITNRTPRELFDEAGYDFYECKTEADIQYFKKYYVQGEELCTFNGNRLRKCHVFWIVKKNVNEIKRGNFKEPKRQDEYGTSVVSIQFERGKENDLSIKNRYNDIVTNPDATFGNNLENIKKGLTASFENEYGFNVTYNKTGFELPNFVKAIDGKLYRYNRELDRIHYCPNNVIIDDRRVVKLDPAKQLLIDYFIVDISGDHKGVKLYDRKIRDSFVDGLDNARKVALETKGGERKVVITTENGNVTIGLNKDNQMISLDDAQRTRVGDKFLFFNKTLETLSMSQLKIVGEEFVRSNEILHTLYLPQLVNAGNYFLNFNKALRTLSLPQLKIVGACFLNWNEELNTIYIPKLIKEGRNFLPHNKSLETLFIPQFMYAEMNFLEENEMLHTLIAPKLKKKGDYMLHHNSKFRDLSAKEIREQSLREMAKRKIAGQTANGMAQSAGTFPLRSTSVRNLSGLKKPEHQTESR